MENTGTKIRTRFAPSPTGLVHIGSLRTALFSFLFARHNGGKHILRIEDTDQNRLVQGAEKNLLEVMRTMGVEFDEGYFLDGNEIKERGNFGPYLQSKRLDIYQQYAKQLITAEKAYYCFCTPERLDELKKEQMALKKPAMYDRHCYKLSAEEKQTKMENFTAAGKKPVVRFLIPEGKTVINDLIFGEISYEHKVLDDQVILKSDGFPTYHLAVVVDDHLMEISHVIRGNEWIPSTPKHILLYQAFGWQPTEFAHLPLILNTDKSKLSKRQGDVSVEDFLSKGYLPEALINFVAFLGWNPKTETEFFSLEQLIKDFEIKNINNSGAVLDINKLDWVNSHYIKQMDNLTLAKKLIPYWKDFGINAETQKLDYLAEISGLEKERLKKLSEIGERTGYFFKAPEYDPGLLVWKKSTSEDAKQKLSELKELLSQINETEFTKENLEAEIKKFIQEKSYDNGSVLWPLRCALTGQEKSPGPFEVCATLAFGLGKQEVIIRLQTAVDKL
jgi:glutamyl-tRNA synthetase